MFSGLRQNALIYILEKGETPTLKVGQVVSVSNPTPRYAQPTNPYSAFSQNVEQVVDISVKTDDGTAVDFKQLPASLAIANQGSVVVADNKEAMTSEVEAMLRTSRSVVESVQRTLNALSAVSAYPRTTSRIRNKSATIRRRTMSDKKKRMHDMCNPFRCGVCQSSIIDAWY